MRTLKGLTALMALAPLAFTSTPASAQEPATPAMQECTAQVEPGTVQSGQKAERVAISLSSPIGNVAELTTLKPDAGIKVADPADLPMTKMSAEETTPKPIEMAAETNSLTVWLNTENATPGTYEFTLKGESGACTGSIKIGDGTL